MFPLSELGRFDLGPGQLAINAVQHAHDQGEPSSKPEMSVGKQNRDSEAHHHRRNRDLVWCDRGPAKAGNEPGLNRCVQQGGKVEGSILGGLADELLRCLLSRRREKDRTEMFAQVGEVGRLRGRVQNSKLTPGEAIETFETGQAFPLEQRRRDP